MTGSSTSADEACHSSTACLQQDEQLQHPCLATTAMSVCDCSVLWLCCEIICQFRLACYPIMHGCVDRHCAWLAGCLRKLDLCQCQLLWKGVGAAKGGVPIRLTQRGRRKPERPNRLGYLPTSEEYWCHGVLVPKAHRRMQYKQVICAAILYGFPPHVNHVNLLL